MLETLASSSTKDNTKDSDVVTEVPMNSTTPAVDPFSVHRVVMHKLKGSESETATGRKPVPKVEADAIPAIDDEDDESDLVAGTS